MLKKIAYNDMGEKRKGEETMETVLYEFGFDISKALEACLPLAIGVICCLGNSYFLKPASPTMCLDRRKESAPPKAVKVIFWSIPILCFLISLVIFVGFYSEYRQCRAMLDNDEVLIVEGEVENFSPYPELGHGSESFEINGVRFSYFNERTNGYHTTADRGGVITGNGQVLRIKYFVNAEGDTVILYIAQID